MIVDRYTLDDLRRLQAMSLEEKIDHSIFMIKQFYEKGETRYQRLKRTYPRQYEFSLGGGEWVTENGKQLWMPNKKGLGFAKVFDMVNEIYGKDLYRYE